MAKYTTNFLTWLKGLFHTKTEVDNLLETKINTVDVQGKITSFTNKDRINIERLINYMENGSGSDYYTLDLKGVKGALELSEGITVFDVTFSDDKDRLPITNEYGGSMGLGYGLVLGAMIYKNGVAQPSMTNTITFKFLDGTVIGTNNDVFTDSTYNQGLRNYKAYKEGWSNATNAWSPGIYYVYAEVTI